MRNGQNKRMRGRGNQNRKSQNPLTRVYESNGPDVKIRGTASHIAEKYIQLARDSQGSGDPVAAENYYQHAEHYFRMIAAAQEQFRQGQPPFYRPEGGDQQREENFDDDGDDHHGHPMMGGNEPSYGSREHQQHQQSYPPRENQPYQPRDGQHQQQRDQQHYGRDQQQHQPFPPRDQQPRLHQPSGGAVGDSQADVGGLPSFITGGGGQPQQSYPQSPGQNGHDGQPDRFSLHRRRRRHRGPRGDMPDHRSGGSSQGGDDFTPGPRPTND